MFHLRKKDSEPGMITIPTAAAARPGKQWLEREDGGDGEGGVGDLYGQLGLQAAVPLVDLSRCRFLRCFFFWGGGGKSPSCLAQIKGFMMCYGFVL